MNKNGIITMSYYNSEIEVFDEGSKNLLSEVVGHSIVSVEKKSTDEWDDSYILTLDDGRKFVFKGVGECCAYGAVEKISLHGKAVSNIITNVKRVKRKTSDGYGESERWFFLADMEETINASNKVMTVDVEADEGTGYYTFGFEIEVVKE